MSFSAPDVMRTSAGTFAAPMMSCYSIRRQFCQWGFVIVYKIEKNCSQKFCLQEQPRGMIRSLRTEFPQPRQTDESVSGIFILCGKADAPHSLFAV